MAGPSGRPSASTGDHRLALAGDARWPHRGRVGAGRPRWPRRTADRWPRPVAHRVGLRPVRGGWSSAYSSPDRGQAGGRSASNRPTLTDVVPMSRPMRSVAPIGRGRVARSRGSGDAVLGGCGGRLDAALDHVLERLEEPLRARAPGPGCGRRRRRGRRPGSRSRRAPGHRSRAAASWRPRARIGHRGRADDLGEALAGVEGLDEVDAELGDDPAADRDDLVALLGGDVLVAGRVDLADDGHARRRASRPRSGRPSRRSRRRPPPSPVLIDMPTRTTSAPRATASAARDHGHAAALVVGPLGGVLGAPVEPHEHRRRAAMAEDRRHVGGHARADQDGVGACQARRRPWPGPRSRGAARCRARGRWRPRRRSSRRRRAAPIGSLRLSPPAPASCSMAGTGVSPATGLRPTSVYVRNALICYSSLFACQVDRAHRRSTSRYQRMRGGVTGAHVDIAVDCCVSCAFGRSIVGSPAPGREPRVERRRPHR